MKRGGFLKRYKGFKTSSKGLKRSALRHFGQSEPSKLKIEIQRLVRDIVIIRDKGCVLRSMLGVPACAGYTNSGELILQADHLITRANSATYDDTRLIVCVCKGHHGWKKWNEKQYEDAIRQVISADRVALWDKAERDRWRPVRRGAPDWKLSIVALNQELKKIQDELLP